MADTITARVSEPLSEPELSRIWESQRLQTQLPEVVFESAGDNVTIRFHGSGRDPQHTRFKRFFEEVVRRYRPQCQIEWA